MRRYFISEHFKKQIKPYIKKHRGLVDDIIETLKNFEKIKAIPLGANTYKVRIKISSMPKGKSHAFRLIILLIERDNLLIPVFLYFKGNRTSISRKDILYHAKLIQKELI